MRKVAKAGLLVMLSLMTSACSKVGLFIANVPEAFNNVKTYENIVYDAETGQKLDLYVPAGIGTNAPVLVFFYGGRWTDGDKAQYRFIADAFTKSGYVVAIPDYRKYPDVKFPAFLEDAASALAWVHGHVKNYNGDPEHIFVAGHSSGAHLGALIATDPKYLAAHNLKRNTIKGFAGLSGPYAFVPKEEDLKDMFGPPERYPLMRAPTFIDGHQPPMLLIQGLKDTTVGAFNAEKLKAAIEEKGGSVTLKTYDELNHVETVGSLMWFWNYKADIKSQMLEFFASNKD